MNTKILETLFNMNNKTFPEELRDKEKQLMTILKMDELSFEENEKISYIYNNFCNSLMFYEYKEGFKAAISLMNEINKDN